MKKIKNYCMFFILLFSLSNTYPSQDPNFSTSTQIASGWFSYFHNSIASLLDIFTKPFSAIKTYMIPLSNPRLQTQKTNVAYNCTEKRLEFSFDDKRPRYFNFVDSYEWSPEKNYILATTFDTSVKKLALEGSLQNVPTKLIDPSSNGKELALFNNIKMYEFSPKETKLLFLTSDITLWQTFGITAASLQHEEPTGIIKKSGSIFTYHVFDLDSKKIIKSFENATGVSFNNESEITVYFEDKAIEVHSLTTSRFTTITQFIFGSSNTQPAEQKIAYNPHQNELILLQTTPQTTLKNVNKFYFSPQKKYLFIESPASWTQFAWNKYENINLHTPMVQLIDMSTGKKIEAFDAYTNIISYEFSPQETKILLHVRTSANSCEYILFDTIKQAFIKKITEEERKELILSDDISHVHDTTVNKMVKALKQQGMKITLPLFLTKMHESTTPKKNDRQPRPISQLSPEKQKAAHTLWQELNEQSISPKEDFTQEDFEKEWNELHAQGSYKEEDSIEHDSSEEDEFFEDDEEELPIYSLMAPFASYLHEDNKMPELFINTAMDEIIAELSGENAKESKEVFDKMLDKYDQKTKQKFNTLYSFRSNFSKANKLLNQIKEQSQLMKESDVNSPAVIREISDLATQLNIIIGKLPLKEKNRFEQEQQKLVTQYQKTYVNTIHSSITAGWNQHKNTIVKIATHLVLPALSVAILPALQAVTGNAPFNSSIVGISMFTSVVSMNTSGLMNEYVLPSTNTLLTGGGSSAVNQMLINYNKSIGQIPSVSPGGILKGALLATVAAEAQNILNQQGGVPQLLKTYSKSLVVRETRPLTLTIEKNIVRSDIAELLAQVAYVTVQSAAVGMAMHFAGLGYSDETTTPEILYYSALRGIVQGSLGYIADLTAKKTGALITAPNALISTGLINYLVKDSALTPQAATTSILQATAQAATDLVIDKSGGFMSAIEKAQKTIGGVFASYWSSVVDFTSTIAEGIAEMNEEGIPVI